MICDPNLFPILTKKIKSWFSKSCVGLICVTTPRCLEMTRLISAEQEKPNSFIMRLRMRLHCGICVWCQRYRDQLGLLGKLSRMFAEESPKHGAAQLSDDAKARMKAALRNEAYD